MPAIDDGRADESTIVSFLALIERDLAARPEALVALTPGLASRIAAATEGVVADPDEPIEGEVAL